MTPVNSHLYSFTNYKVCSCILFSVFFQNILVKCDKIHGLITILKKAMRNVYNRGTCKVNQKAFTKHYFCKIKTVTF